MIATDFLNSAKSGIRNTAFAITETASPELRAALREQLRSAVKTHHPQDISEQSQVNLKAANTALNLSQK
ncbi:spore coat protein [Peribacillus sp. NJ11]|uniref:spore coat protein n=1 Tax=Peribacillus TaxID=2675229 RepID=UPI0025A052F6|nr:spore coat protein [Peribacillus sp. NJ11]MDM5223452.1 spore coat protein [Peribacillus sp. NJ11]